MSKIFNAENTEWKTGEYSLFCGQAPGLFDSVNVRYPEIKRIYKMQISQRWVEGNINHDQSKMDLAQCPVSIREIMLYNLAYQWSIDTVAARSLFGLFAPFITCSELLAAIQENSNMEVVHSLAYSEIIRHCVPDPNEVFKMVMETQETLDRGNAVATAIDEILVAGRKYAAGEMSVDEGRAWALYAAGVMYILERESFMSSFAATFAVVKQGYFESIGKEVQKIMMDELVCHAGLWVEVFKIEKANGNWKRACEQFGIDKKLELVFNEVMRKELDWPVFLLSNNRQIVGLTSQLMREWALFNAQPVRQLLEIDKAGKFEYTGATPLVWMDDWLNPDKTQNAQQEADGSNYLLNVVVDDLPEEEMLDF